MGTIALTAADFPPPNTMFAAGQTLPISQYSALFSLLQTTYGGNGTTNFKVPDLRQQAPGKTNYTMCIAGDYPTRT
jgi:microcystin-dependent protein